MTSLDRQLRAWTARRTQAADRIVDAMIDLLHADQAIDLLLDRKAEEQAAEQPGRMS